MTPSESMNSAAGRAGRDGVIVMNPGIYPAQTVRTGSTGDCVSATEGKTADCRVFLAKPGVRIGNLRIEGAGTAIVADKPSDLQIAGAYSLSGASESLIRSATIDPPDGAPGLYLDHTTRFALLHSEVKGVLDNDGVDIYGGATGAHDNRIVGNDIHDVKLTATSCQHTDGIQSAQTTGQPNTATLIAHNHIYDIDQNADIQLDSTLSGRATDERVIDNTLGQVNYRPTSCVPTPYPRSITLSGNHLEVSGNSAAQPFFIYPGSGTIAHNDAPAPQFSGGAGCQTYAMTANVWTSNPYGDYCS